MVARTMWLTLVAVGVLAASGLGFAAFTATATSTITGTGGTLSMSWSNAATTSSAGTIYDATYVTCTAAIGGSGSQLTVAAGNLAPGDWCDVTATLTNTGSVAATVTSTMTSSGATGCFEFAQFSISPAHLAPGGTYSYEAAIELGDHAGNSCQAESATWVTTLTASASTGETGEPHGGPSSPL